MEISSPNSIEIIVWLNGCKSDNYFKYSISNLQKTHLKYLKEGILQYMKVKSIFSSVLKKSAYLINPDNIHLYTNKEIELNDDDIQYLKNDDILFISFDNSPFAQSNHFYQYKFIKCLKAGGYGKVFVVKHIISQKEFAIKQIDVSTFSTEELFNISREQIILQSLQNNNVIKWYDSFTYNNNFFTVMDYAKGGELTALLKEKGKLSEKDAKVIFKQIHRAVKFIHNKNIIHRDLKPNNMLFIDKERTKLVLIDFGISGFSTGKNKEIVRAGTLKYLAPEMASGLNYQSDPALDIWSMGVILYQMVMGEFPFDGKNDKQIIANIIHSPVIFNPKIKISNECKELIKGLLEKNIKFRIDINNQLFENWYNHTSIAKKANNNTDNGLRINLHNRFPFKSFGNDCHNDIYNNFNAYLSPHKHNIRQHINDYLNSVEMEVNKKKLKINSNKKINLISCNNNNTNNNCKLVRTNNNASLFHSTNITNSNWTKLPPINQKEFIKSTTSFNKPALKSDNKYVSYSNRCDNNKITSVINKNIFGNNKNVNCINSIGINKGEIKKKNSLINPKINNVFSHSISKANLNEGIYKRNSNNELTYLNNSAEAI